MAGKWRLVVVVWVGGRCVCGEGGEEGGRGWWWWWWWWWFGLGDLTKCLWRYLSHACTINSGGRTLGRLTPGVPATPSPP